MTFAPIFEVVQTEMFAVDGAQSTEIAAIGFDGTRLLVQFHRLAGIYAAPATRVQYEHLLDAESISVDYAPVVSEVVTGLPQHFSEHHKLTLQPRRKRH